LNERPDIPGDEPGIDISFQLPLDDGSGRVIVFRSLVPQGCSDDQFNEVLDKLARAGERQKAKVLLPTYQSELDSKKEMLVAETQKLLELQVERSVLADRWQQSAAASGRRNPKPGPQERQDHIQLQAKIAQCEQNIRVLEKQIASEEQRVSIYKNRLSAEE
jgi:hypothetical protein